MNQYTWQNYRCTYEVYPETSSRNDLPPLLLIHPIGVGLSGKFWHRFCQEWKQLNQQNTIYNPDLLGCGESDKPHVACMPKDWAEQLQFFLKTIVQKPAIVIVQGALLPVALELANIQPDLVKALVLAGPPAWPLITQPRKKWRQKLAWNLFDSPFGNLFYRYARRRQFLQSFSSRQLFGSSQDVDTEWLDTLKAGSQEMKSRFAVFSFLAGFWRQDYQETIQKITQPTLVLVGETASSISQEGKQETPEDRLSDYLKYFPNGQGQKMSGRNVLPYEATAEFTKLVANFVNKLT